MVLNKVGAVSPAAPTPIDIIVPVHGMPELTVRCIKTLYMFTQTPFHLIVLDDTDASIEYGAFHRVDPADITSPYFEKLAKQVSNLTYINRQTPYKCGNEFFNEGFKYCHHEYVATVMNSLLVEPWWETRAIQLMNQDPEIGVIGFKCLFLDGRVESAGIVFSGHIPCDWGRDEPGYRQSEIMQLDAVQWAFALLRRRAVEGNLREDLFHGFVGWDDIDNCFAVREKGWKVLYCGAGIGLHQPRATRGDNSIEAAVKNRENSWTFWKRWGLWEKYQEAQKMDVSFKLKPETKTELSNVVYEVQVLEHLLNERREILKQLGSSAMKELGVAPNQYTLEMNPMQNLWNLKMIPQKDEGNGQKEGLAITEEVAKV